MCTIIATITASVTKIAWGTEKPGLWSKFAKEANGRQQQSAERQRQEAARIVERERKYEAAKRTRDDETRKRRLRAAKVIMERRVNERLKRRATASEVDYDDNTFHEKAFNEWVEHGTIDPGLASPLPAQQQPIKGSVERVISMSPPQPGDEHQGLPGNPKHSTLLIVPGAISTWTLGPDGWKRLDV